MFITGTSRDQLNLFEEKLDELISRDNPARFIDAYVEKLDLKKIGFKIPGTYGGKEDRRTFNDAEDIHIWLLKSYKEQP